jgi:hypothetical protein
LKEVGSSKQGRRKKCGLLSISKVGVYGIQITKRPGDVKLRICSRPQRSPALIPYSSIFTLLYLSFMIYVRASQIPASSSRA